MGTFYPKYTARDVVVTDEVTRILAYRKTLLSQLEVCDNELARIREEQLADGTIKLHTPQWTARPSAYTESQSNPKFRDIDQTPIRYICTCGWETPYKLDFETHLVKSKHQPLGEQIGKTLKKRDRDTVGEPVVKRERVTQAKPRAVDSWDDISG